MLSQYPQVTIVWYLSTEVAHQGVLSPSIEVHELSIRLLKMNGNTQTPSPHVSDDDELHEPKHSPPEPGLGCTRKNIQLRLWISQAPVVGPTTSVLGQSIGSSHRPHDSQDSEVVTDIQLMTFVTRA